MKASCLRRQSGDVTTLTADRARPLVVDDGALTRALGSEAREVCTWCTGRSPHDRDDAEVTERGDRGMGARS
jgi:hypothetical protein